MLEDQPVLDKDCSIRP